MARSSVRATGFSARALFVARASHGLTQVELARRLGTSRQYLQQLEHGHGAPNALMLARLAEALNFDQTFFSAPFAPHVDENLTFFRRLASTGARERLRATALVGLLLQLIERLTMEVTFPHVPLPLLSGKTDEDIERAATRAREILGVGVDAPIRNLTRAVERLGIFVVDLDSVDGRIDAFSARQSPPVIVRSTSKQSSSRARMDLAHELGHMLLHRTTAGDRSELEAQATRFAGALLLPPGSFAREFPRSDRWLWRELLRLKSRWGASAGAMVERAHQLRLITPERRAAAWAYMSRMGWRRGPEPEEPLPETPELLVLAAREIYRAKGATPLTMLGDLGWTPDVLRLVVGATLFDDLMEIGAPGVVIRLDDMRKSVESRDPLKRG
jgi:Zn-dependent peptidase ImmA (M78 family)/transcriptional regulator with XRE-family HTH domain